MCTFDKILPRFLKADNSSQNTGNLRVHVMGHGRVSPSILRRRSDGVEAALASAESRLATLRKKVDASISAYEKHYRFLRQAAYAAVHASSPTRNNERVLQARKEELAEVFEEIESAIQVARLKAEAQKKGLEKVVGEIERERESKNKDKITKENASRAKAPERWQAVEWETEVLHGGGSQMNG